MQIDELNPNPLIGRRDQAFASNSRRRKLDQDILFLILLFVDLLRKNVVLQQPQDAPGISAFPHSFPDSSEISYSNKSPKEIKIEKRFPITLQILQKPKVSPVFLRSFFLLHPITWEVSQQTISLIYKGELGI